MKQAKASAPGKIILFGEHAVVYQRPAIAIPIHQVQATATLIEDHAHPNNGLFIQAPQINLQGAYNAIPAEHPISLLLRLILEFLHIEKVPDLTLALESTIPLASGMGSGAAISVAAIRAFSTFFDSPLTREQVNSIAFQVEKKYHGTPSGIDNTVITYEQPIYFVRGTPFQRLQLGQPMTIMIADSGIPSTTLEVVADVRRGWQEDPQTFEALFDEISDISMQARQILEHGPVADLGPLMNANQQALRKMGVSSPRLDYLVDAALFSGALGAKLSGGGRGGNIIALAEPDLAGEIAHALQQAGATHIITTTETPNNHE